jgi:plasmid replication initiation protein
MEKNVKSVTKSNALINAGYRLSLTEIQIILYGISLINPLQKDFPLNYRIDINRFAEMFNREHCQIYNEVKEAVLKRFWERDFSYTDDKGKIVTLRWLTKIVHEDKTGYLEIKFSEEIQPYLHQLKNNFTTYYIDQISKFKSVYSIRFYEYSIMFLNKKKIDKGRFLLLIDEIRQLLEIGKMYDRFSNFKSRVLEPAKKEINSFSDLNFNYKVFKRGRTPYEVEFSVSKKQQRENTEHKLLITKVSTTTLEKAKEIAIAAGTRWDIYVIEEEFYAYMKKAGLPRNLEAAFIGFVKKKVAQLSG